MLEYFIERRVFTPARKHIKFSKRRKIVRENIHVAILKKKKKNWNSKRECKTCHLILHCYPLAKFSNNPKKKKMILKAIEKTKNSRIYSDNTV